MVGAEFGGPVVLFDHRLVKGPNDQFSYIQSSWFEAKYRLGWPSLYQSDVPLGRLRLVWYTSVGNEGHRDYPLSKYLLTKELFDSLSVEGCRPMIVGWSGQNPYPEIGGVVPKDNGPKNWVNPTMKRADESYDFGSGHSNAEPVYDRVMGIIERVEKEEAEGRAREVRGLEQKRGVEEKNAV